jgi:hypothetical protein
MEELVVFVLVRGVFRDLDDRSDNLRRLFADRKVEIIAHVCSLSKRVWEHKKRHSYTKV